MKLFLFILPIVLAMSMSFLLFFKRKHNIPSTKVLAFYLFVFAILLMALVFVSFPMEENIFTPIINLVSLLFYVGLLAIPSTLYLYIVTLTHRSEVFGMTEHILVHYYPAIALLIINLFAFGYIYAGNENTDIYKSSIIVMGYANFISLFFLFPLFNIFYIYKSFILYKNHQQKVKEMYVHGASVNLKWIRTFIIGYIIFIIGIYFLQMTTIENLHLPFSVLLTVYILFTGIQGLRQNYTQTKTLGQGHTKHKHENASPAHVSQQADTNTPETGKASMPKGEILDNHKKSKLRSQLIKLMEEDTIFLERKLTIHQVAGKLNSNSKYISHVLNTDFNQNFTSFINTYRIKKAQELLADHSNRNLTIEVIAEMSGFNSKSTFNTAFKNICKRTPSAFRKEILDKI